MANQNIDIRLVEQTGASALVEYWKKGRLNRVIVPVVEIRKGKVKSEILDAGIPWGEAWESLPYPQVTPDQIADELHRQGIWTKEDVLKNRGAVSAAIQQVHGPIIQIIMQFINER